MNAGEALRPRDRGMGSAVIPGCCCHPARLLDIDLWLFHEVILIVIWTWSAFPRLIVKRLLYLARGDDMMRFSRPTVLSRDYSTSQAFKANFPKPAQHLPLLTALQQLSYLHTPSYPHSSASHSDWTLVIYLNHCWPSTQSHSLLPAPLFLLPIASL
ncbi:hypothetical protein PGT21_022427 [Puccinia graminis f. sp. tritici]|uniref:Uncharacterized protein n=1 Tax=Puccinia graminis f. sp. tritici TaxID=56615 RepID=A0A5B0PY88_PUCGR|nr:hypothetical protein PGT21_022427 [Puccinia graminis f. sp. tritici]